MKRKRRMFAVSDSSSNLAFIEAKDKQGARARYELVTGAPIPPQYKIREARWRPKSSVPWYIYAGDRFKPENPYLCDSYQYIDWPDDFAPSDFEPSEEYLRLLEGTRTLKH